MSNIFTDGLTNVFNKLINRRSGLSQNVVDVNVLSEQQMRAVYRTGLGSKIIRIKAGQSLNDTLTFDSTSDREFYELRLERAVKKAAKFMIGFGRGIIVLHSRGDSLEKPLGNIDPVRIKIDVFSGDMVTVSSVSTDLNDPRYLLPEHFQVRGHTIHWTRVVDFKYVEPVELDAPLYNYGGISEFELIYNQIINDGIVERASSAILEKSSNFIYKIEGFKDALRANKDDELFSFFERVEDMRSIYGAVLIDSADDVTNINQTLTNLAEVDQITLRRLSMVTGIVLPILVGENVKGLNSTGDNESKIHQDMLSGLQSEFLIDPINELLRKFDKPPASFKENQGQTAGEKVSFDKLAIDNAVQLLAMGEDHSKYLNDKGVTEPDNFEEFFSGEERDQGGEANENQITELPQI
jgi:hypothetical protein